MICAFICNAFALNSDGKVYVKPPATWENVEMEDGMQLVVNAAAFDFSININTDKLSCEELAEGRFYFGADPTVESLVNYNLMKTEALDIILSDGYSGIFSAFLILKQALSNSQEDSTKAKGSVKTPSKREIQINSKSPRSVADIMKVVCQRIPDLHHIYNKFLKKKTGIQGKVTLKLAINPSGDVNKIVIVSSTTGYKKFDKAIKNAVGHWKFSQVFSGNTTIVIPFTFSEY